MAMISLMTLAEEDCHVSLKMRAVLSSPRNQKKEEIFGDEEGQEGN